ncbi:HlyD family efflux transporter periplasmic adaptor subunit [Fulvivirgaceae bacterium BMA12]|uniref:HlyD family efflux transporter periplasmic adaptor subunit n=1 Tax=Agaribacillus aureus TaxID=3051825 RepID=A0ABT8L017_9BACT|nr:HlyD family efflux transporter periplasmic adaptor subunit [Fulvivirgaceae bacterium BMA12]
MKNNQQHYEEVGINPYEGIHRRSDEIQDMIGAVPHWLVRTGISLIFAVLMVLLTISWFIKYPDILHADVLITTNPAPVTLVARSSGPIVVLMKEKEAVKKGDVLGLIKSPEDWRVILQLEAELMAPKAETGEYTNLGPLQDYYNRYTLAKSQWHLFLAMDDHNRQISQIQKQLVAHEKLKSNLVQQWQLTKVQQDLAATKFKADSTLFTQNVIPKVDFQQRKKEFLQSRKESERMGASLINQEVRIEELKALQTKLSIAKQSESNQLWQALANTKSELLAQIGNWKTAHLFIAPTEGRLSYLDILHDNQYIPMGKALFSLVPDRGEILAIATLPVAGAGKVDIGQQVNIKLDHYPHEQYGMLRGVVRDFPIISVEDHYQVELSLPNQLETTYGKALSIRQNLTGQTEVITEDLRLMEKMFHWLKSIKYRLQGQ